MLLSSQKNTFLRLDNFSSTDNHSVSGTLLSSIHWKDVEQNLGAHCPMGEYSQASTEHYSRLKRASMSILGSCAVSELSESVYMQLASLYREPSILNRPRQQQRK
jgi:hypothetical protein